MEKLKISGLSLDIKWHNPEVNLMTVESFIGKISHTCDIMILPEMFTTGFTMHPNEVAESMDGPTINKLISIAKKYNINVGGSLVISEAGQYFNRFVLCSSNGIEMFYDKQYLFSPAGENEVYHPGNEKKVFHYKGWNICPQICYDLRFPESSRNITKEIDLIIYVASWPSQRTNHWDALLRARAIENQCYVMGVNRIGADENGMQYLGHSSIYQFDGKQIAFDSGEEKGIEGVLDWDELQLYRKKLPFLNDRK